MPPSFPPGPSHGLTKIGLPSRIHSPAFLFSSSFPPISLPASLVSGSHDRDLHAVDRRQRIEEATPFLTPFTTDPKLAGCGAEVERGRAKVVDVHCVPQDREVAILLRHSAC